MTRNHILDTDNQEVNFTMLAQLLTSINENSCYDKVGQYFYELENSMYTIGIADYDLVVAFLDDLELRPSTSKTCRYDYRKPLEFDGFMYSQATDIYYTVLNGKLHKLPMYKRNENAQVKDSGKATDDTQIIYTMQSIEWEPSEFSNINCMADAWVKATNYQVGKFKISEKWDTYLHNADCA